MNLASLNIMTMISLTSVIVFYPWVLFFSFVTDLLVFSASSQMYDFSTVPMLFFTLLMTATETACVGESGTLGFLDHA